MEEDKVFVCPVADVTCPYFKYGNCSMYPEDNPILECDEAMMYDDDYHLRYSEEEDDCDYETGFDPYLGCYTDDC